MRLRFGLRNCWDIVIKHVDIRLRFTILVYLWVSHILGMIGCDVSAVWKKLCSHFLLFKFRHLCYTSQISAKHSKPKKQGGNLLWLMIQFSVFTIIFVFGEVLAVVLLFSLPWGSTKPLHSSIWVMVESSNCRKCQKCTDFTQNTPLFSSVKTGP